METLSTLPGLTAKFTGNRWITLKKVQWVGAADVFFAISLNNPFN